MRNLLDVDLWPLLAYSGSPEQIYVHIAKRTHTYTTPKIRLANVFILRTLFSELKEWGGGVLTQSAQRDEKSCMALSAHSHRDGECSLNCPELFHNAETMISCWKLL